jgi:hypothetical protein
MRVGQKIQALPRQIRLIVPSRLGYFDDLCRGDAVSYVEQAGDTGPTASKVRVIGK